MRTKSIGETLNLVMALALVGCSSTGSPSAKQQSDSTVAIDTALAVTAGRLVFQDAGRVRTALSDGSEQMDVAMTVDDQEHPDWSRDGARLVFETGFSTLWIVNGDGSDLETVYECAAPCHSLQDGAWSPDGREIAFAVAETQHGTTTSRSAIVSLDVESGSVRTLYEDRSGQVWLFHPRWSRDGTSIVFEEDTFASDSLSETTVTRLAIKVVSAVGGAEPDEVAAWAGPTVGPGAPDPDWSSVDEVIVFSRDDNLFTVNPDGTSETQLTHFDGVTEHAIQPTFTPDGTGVVFTFVKGQFGVDDVPNAALIQLDGASLTQLGGSTHMTHPRLQP